MNDSCVFEKTIRKPSLKFPHLPPRICYGNFLYVGYPHILFCNLISFAFDAYQENIMSLTPVVVI